VPRQLAAGQGGHGLEILRGRDGRAIPMQIFSGVIDSVRHRRRGAVTLQLTSLNQRTLFIPRRRITAATGFNHLMPAGRVIEFDGVRYEINEGPAIMASYPSIEVDRGAARRTRSTIDRSTSGPTAASAAAATSRPGAWKWKLFHLELSDANKVTLKAFYDANRLRTDISFVSPWDGVTYNNIMFTAAQVRALPGGSGT
jgi:hypothetical protein